MKKKIIYTDEPDDVDLDNARVVKDFLPRPKDLVLRKEKVVTLRLDEATAKWLKQVADQKGLGISSLARMWLIERLSGESKPLR
jgi:hypothetical protein